MKEYLMKLWEDFMPKLSTAEAVLATFLAAIAQIYGGWTAGMTLLVIGMAIDYISGLIVAGFFHNSMKTETGRLESRAGWKGLIRKGMILAMVLVAAKVDATLNTDFIRDAVVIGFITNEIISIVENAGLMGIPIPKALMNMIELLKKKADEETAQLEPIQAEHTNSDPDGPQEGEKRL